MDMFTTICSKITKKYESTQTDKNSGSKSPISKSIIVFTLSLNFLFENLFKLSSYYKKNQCFQKRKKFQD